MWKENDKKILNSFLKWFAIIISIKLAIIFFFFLHVQNKTINSKQENTQIPNFCFNEKCINLEIARTPQERELGLMFRETLKKDSWMFFAFDGLWKHSIWMKNTLIPLDIIRLTTGYKVVDIVSAPPCKQEDCPIYKPNNDNLWAIEINSGVANEIWLKTGDTINLNI